MHRSFASSRVKTIFYKSIFPSTHLKGGKKEKSLKKKNNANKSQQTKEAAK